jgi:hypothetical protein
LVSSVIRAIAMLNRRVVTPSRTPAIVRCSARSVSSSGSTSSAARTAPVCSSTTTRQIRCSSRCEPTTALVSQGRDWSSGPVDISYTRNVSAP